MKIGLISDTHGLLRPQAVYALKGVDAIIHAGDIGSDEILEQLADIAPVHAVRGNNDRASWANAIPEFLDLEFGKRRIYVLHNLHELSVDPKQYAVVISGHSHRPKVDKQNGVLFVNPGSAGPRRFNLPVCLGTLNISKTSVNAKLIQLL